MSSTTKTSKGLSLWTCLVTALLISLNVMEAESERCYWCGPLADDVHSRRRAPQCSATGNQMIECRETEPHCAFVISGFPYKESRICSSLYQDECYSAYCDSSRTWRVTCPCRGDLCNGEKSAREIEAFKRLPAQTARYRVRREADDPAPAGDPAPPSPADDPAPLSPADDPAPPSPADDPAPPSPAADNTLTSPTLDTLADDQTKQEILTTTDSPPTLTVPAINSENNVPINDYLSDQPNNPEQSLDNHADDNTIRASNIVSPVETKTEVTTETRMEHEKSETTSAFAGMATTAENQVKLEAKKGSPTAEALQHDQAPEDVPTMAVTVAELTSSQKMLDIACTNTTSTEPHKNMATMPLGHTKQHLLIVVNLLIVIFFII